MSKRFLSMTRAFVIGLVTIGFSTAALGADSDWIMQPMSPDLDDTPSLQRGANLYVNFCLGCHSLEHQRYERTADDLGEIPHELMVANVIHTGQKIGEHIQSAMSEEDAKAWFGGRRRQI